MARFLLTNVQRVGGVPQRSMETTHPPASTARQKRSSLDLGYSWSAPQPGITTVTPPASRAAVPASWSQPTAPPETTVTPHSAETRPAILAQASP